MKKKLVIMISYIMCIVVFALTACDDGGKDKQDSVVSRFEITQYKKETLIADLSEYYSDDYNINVALRRNESAQLILARADFAQELYDSKISIYEIYAIYSKCRKGFFGIDDNLIPIKHNDGKYYPLYVLGRTTDIYIDLISSAMKELLRNPESLQLHSAKLYVITYDDLNARYFTGYVMLNVFEDSEGYGYIYTLRHDLLFAEVDYSAQNGFGGMNRRTIVLSYDSNYDKFDLKTDNTLPMSADFYANLNINT